MDERIKVYDEKMTKTFNNLLSEFATIRAGRANPSILSKIRVDYYGTPTPLQQIGTSRFRSRESCRFSRGKHPW